MFERYFDFIPRNICGIYKITNLLNNQVYIGQSIDIRRRWASHWSVAQRIKQGLYSNCPIDISLSQHEITDFKWEVIEECSMDLLDEREKYWIQYYDSYIHGYNATLGGQNFERFEPEFVAQVEKLLLETDISFEDIASMANVSIQVVSNINRGISWNKPNMTYPLRPHEKKVIQYDHYGNQIAIYDTVSQAAEAIGTSSGSVSAVCKKTRQSCKGYIFRYADDELPTKQPLKRRNSKIVVQKTLDGQEVARYSSLAEAAEAMECSVKDHIGRVCRGERKSYKGYLWSYLDVD